MGMKSAFTISKDAGVVDYNCIKWRMKIRSTRMKTLVAAVLLGGTLANAAGDAQQMRCPQDKRSDDAATGFTVSIGTVTMPVGAFLLVRNGSQLGAIRLTSL